MRVLITGATGTVGSAVVERLACEPEYEVHAVVRRPAAMPARVQQQVVDLSAENFHTALKPLEYDAIIHCAQPREWTSKESSRFDLHVVEGLERLASDHTLCLYTGGVWIYGHQEEGRRITERTPYRPIGYARSRMATLAYLEGKSPCGWTHVVLPSLVYGTEGPLQGMVQGLLEGSAAVLNDNTLLWSVIERLDVAEAYMRLVKRGLRGRTFLLAEPEPVAILHVHRRVADRLGVPLHPLARGDALARFGPELLEVVSMSQPVDASALFAALDWRPAFSFSTRVEEVVGPRQV